MINSQSQKGGDESTNIQAQQMVVHIGIDEKRAREICQEMTAQLRKEYSHEALEIAQSRVNDFESKLVQKMAQIQGAMEAFADPSFQLLLVEAQKAAAATERPADHDLLSELLAHRFQKRGNRNARAGISFAVEIVDKISDEALLALTVSHAVTHFIPLTGDLSEGLNVLDGLFGKLIYNALPAGQEWLDHLDILNAVRLNPLGGLKPLAQYYSEALSGYVDTGIHKDSNEHEKAIEILEKNKIPLNILIEHKLNRDFVRLNISTKENIKMLNWQHFWPDGRLFKIEKISKEQVMAMNEVYALYSQDASIRQNNTNSFVQEWDKRPNLREVRLWWDGISVGFNVTSVGKVLAHSNAQRCDKNLPPLD